MDQPPEHAVDVLGLTEILGVSKDTIYSMARSGEIPSIRLGRLWRFYPTQVREHLEAEAAARRSDLWARPSRSKVARAQDKRLRH
ncbi:helix-turn-helix domain-containing protein [Amnibacterium kyonggiense]|uniref:AlpA family transcriptional regulator n=1 Tax=Amnibacterium kyonggiense TaxID=595671 RepID=A0A4R7FIG5_9MICO|nr:AlpA family transcriptional regulator [Amnibacterium kyonggiense]